MSLNIEGVDYAWGTPDYDALQRAGKKFAMRYLSGGGSKDLTVGERDRLYAKGIAVGLVWETTGGRALSGKAGGVEDAKRADAEVKRLGLDGIPVYFAVDFDATPGQVNPYLSGAASVLGKARTGVYGSDSVVGGAADIVGWFWQTYAWSGGRVSSRAHVLQYRNGVTIGGLDCDLDKASAKGMESMRGPGAGRDVISYLTAGERSWVLRLEKYRANARKRGKWIDSEREAAEKIKVQEGEQINKLQKLGAPEKHNRRERIRVLRNSRANRPLDAGF